MRRASREEEWAALVGVGLLAVLCVVGAFLGASRARAVFNSPPVATLWIALAALTGLRLLRVRALRVPAGVATALMGVLLVLLGGLYGSKAGHRIRARPLGGGDVFAGRLLLGEGHESDRVLSPDLEADAGRLPFALRVDRVLIGGDGPSPERWRFLLVVPQPGGKMAVTPISAQPGHETDLSGTGVRLHVLGLREEPAVGDDGSVVPVLDLRLSMGQAEVTKQLAPRSREDVAVLPLLSLMGSESVPKGVSGPMLWLLGRPRQAPATGADAAVVVDGREVARAVVAVNRPLHYGGYYIHLAGGGEGADLPYADLLVRSDAGLVAVYAGFGLFLLGVFWMCWFSPILRGARARRAP